MTIQEIVSRIKMKQPEIRSVFFVGCGASMADLFPAKYFLEQNAKMLRCSMYTANNFNYSTPPSVDDTAIVVTCSLSGNTPESVAATKLAASKGAHVVSITNKAGSPLDEEADYAIIHGFSESYGAKMEKPARALEFACEVLNAYEGYAYYEDMHLGLSRIFDLINESIPMVAPLAKKFAEENFDADILYVMSSGATQYTAYGFSMFLMMEMQWLKSSSFHCGEFFHGPFELSDETAHYLLMMNDGPTRPMDERALAFLQRTHANYTVIDAKDFGLSSHIPASVVEYFNPLLIGGLDRPFGEEIAKLRQHPLTMRRYMWKMEY
ncbi:SIS domain-containing protein [Oscillospiraceae bacterium 44-34]